MKNKIIVGVLVVIAIAMVFLFNGKPEAAKELEPLEEVTEEDIQEDVKETSKYKVDIKGAVNKPGVYEVDSTLRVNDVIALAGGLKKTANTNYINLSAKVTDEMVIWVYTKDEIKEFKLEQTSSKYMITSCNCPTVDNTTCLNSSNNNASDKTNAGSGMVNINTATLDELMTLDGIGESKAKSIIEYRKTNGNFKTPEDIMNVSGIGSSVYEKIKNRLSV